jgi:predicted DNA-binding transcriptional regulator YafY
MSRSERLLALLQLLRRHRQPVSGAALADDLGVSLRTLYRDIRSLQAQGAGIDGEPGLGYVLRPGFLLPPLMFSEEEIEALALGARWVTQRTDGQLAVAARDALAKIAAVLPADRRDDLDSPALLVGSGAAVAAGQEHLSLIRLAIRRECQLAITYLDQSAVETTRTIWPIALAYFDHVRVVVAWCALRQAFRHFRTDRITALALSDQRYPRRRRVLLAEWRQAEGVPPQ